MKKEIFIVMVPVKFAVLLRGNFEPKLKLMLVYEEFQLKQGGPEVVRRQVQKTNASLRPFLRRGLKIASVYRPPCK